MKILLPWMAEGQTAQLRAAAPDAELVEAAADEAPRLIVDADGAYGFVTPELLRAARKLRWVQVGSAGVETYLSPELVESEVVLTNAKGIYGTQLAEHTLAFIFAFARNFHVLWRRQQQEVWESRNALAPHELRGETLLVVGLGGTGYDTAWRAHALGMRVQAVTSTMRPFPDFIRKAGGKERLHEYLGEADYVALCCALTPETRKLFGDREFEAMKPTAYLTNVTRGGVIDTEALVRALERGAIAGAGLDVTDPEPLPPGHPLWRMENVILTPHTSGHSPHANGRMFALLKENLRRFVSGEPLLNVVDKRRGF